MATKFLNRVRMSVSGTPGTGTVTLNTQATGFQAFNGAGMSDGDQTPYLIEDGTPLGSTWEIGIGTWHSNQTFTRDTVTQSSAGGTSKITAGPNAVISAIFRASDLAGAQMLSALTDTNIVSPTTGQLLVFNSTSGKWENHTPAVSGASTPTVVQYSTIQQTSAGNCNVTLGAAPTMGNLLVAIGQGGGSSFSGVYSPGFSFAGADATLGAQVGAGSQYEVLAGIRGVRSGDSASQQIGSVGGAGYEFNGVLVELAGVDISRFSPLMWRTGSFGSTTTKVTALSQPGNLMLAFYAGASGALTVSQPGTVQYNNDDGTSRLMFLYDTATGPWNGVDASTSASNGVMIINLSGV